jgi:hypothetical protein
MHHGLELLSATKVFVMVVVVSFTKMYARNMCSPRISEHTGSELSNRDVKIIIERREGIEGDLDRILIGCIVVMRSEILSESVHDYYGSGF